MNSNNPIITDEIRKLVADGKTLDAIRRYRRINRHTITTPLKEAIEAIEAIKRQVNS